MALPSYNSSLITAVVRAQQGLSFPVFVAGGRGGASGTTYALEKKGTSYTYALWRSKVYSIGGPFEVRAIKFGLTAAVASNMTITPVISLDDDSSVVSSTVINSTNYANSELFIQLAPDNFGGNVKGEKNFYLEFRFSGSALVGIMLPIMIDIETEEAL